MYFSLYCKGSKRVTQGFTVRGSWRPNRTAIYWPLLLWPSALCLSCSPGLLNRRIQDPLCWVRAFPTASCHQRGSKLTGGPLLPGGGFPYHISTPTRPSPTPWLPVSSSYIIVQSPTQSPTQSLEWHVWSSSSGNNCHAVQRSLSSGASVYECIMGFFTLSHFFRQATYAISSHNCLRNASLPSGASLWNGMLAGSKVNIQHLPPTQLLVNTGERSLYLSHDRPNCECGTRFFQRSIRRKAWA